MTYFHPFFRTIDGILVINNDILPFPTSKIIIFTLFQFIYNLGEFCWLLLHVSHQNRQAAKFDAQVLSSALYFTFFEQSWSPIVPVQFLVHRLTAPLLEGYSRVDFIRTQSSTSTRWMLRAGTNYQLSFEIPKPGTVNRITNANINTCSEEQVPNIILEG